MSKKKKKSNQKSDKHARTACAISGSSPSDTLIVMSKEELEQLGCDIITRYEQNKAKKEQEEKNARRQRIFSELGYVEYDTGPWYKRSALQFCNTLKIWFCKMCWGDIKVLLPAEKPIFTIFHLIPFLSCLLLEVISYIIPVTLWTYTFYVPSVQWWERLGAFVLGVLGFGLVRIGPRIARLRVCYTSNDDKLVAWTSLVVSIIGISPILYSLFD